MESVETIVQSGLICAIIAVVFLCFALSDRSFPKRIRNLFRFAAAILVALVASDGLNMYAGLQPLPSALSYITDALGYTLRPLLILEVALIVKRQRRKNTALVFIPFIINALVIISNIFFPGVVFAYSPENEFIRGAAGWMPFAVSLIYLVLLLAWSIEKYIRQGSRDYIIALAMLFGIAAALYMEIYKQYEFMTVGISAIGCVFYYLYLHIQIYSHDALTGALDRRSFFLDAQKLKHDEYIVVSLDVNNLKDINDSFGHAEGDRALCTVVDTVHRFLPSRCTLYRVGGDEFEVICRHIKKETVESTMRLFETALAKTSYGAAYGIAVYEPGMSIEELCSVADKDMYSKKHDMKSPE